MKMFKWKFGSDYSLQNEQQITNWDLASRIVSASQTSRFFRFTSNAMRTIVVADIWFA